MARRHEDSGKSPGRAGETPARPELVPLLPLVRLLARQAARESWSASLFEDAPDHDDDPRP